MFFREMKSDYNDYDLNTHEILVIALDYRVLRVFEGVKVELSPGMQYYLGQE